MLYFIYTLQHSRHNKQYKKHQTLKTEALHGDATFNGQESRHFYFSQRFAHFHKKLLVITCLDSELSADCRVDYHGNR